MRITLITWGSHLINWPFPFMNFPDENPFLSKQREDSLELATICCCNKTPRPKVTSGRKSFFWAYGPEGYPHHQEAQWQEARGGSRESTFLSTYRKQNKLEERHWGCKPSKPAQQGYTFQRFHKPPKQSSNISADGTDFSCKLS